MDYSTSKGSLPVALIPSSAITNACHRITQRNLCFVSTAQTLWGTEHPIITNRTPLRAVHARPSRRTCARAVHVITRCIVHAVTTLRALISVLSEWTSFQALQPLESTWTRANSIQWITWPRTKTPNRKKLVYYSVPLKDHRNSKQNLTTSILWTNLHESLYPPT